MKKILMKLLIASFLVGGVNNLQINFRAENLQIISVAYAEVQNVIASDTAIFDFGEDNEKIVNTVKNIAKMRAEQAAKEKAGVFIKSRVQTVNGVLTDDDISAYTSNNIEILDVQYKKIPIQANNLQGNNTGKIGFMYEATVTAKIDTSNLSAYVRLDEQEKSNLISQNYDSQKNFSKINHNFETLRKNLTENISADINKIDDEVLARQKFNEGRKLYYQKNYQGAVEKFTESLQIIPNLSTAYHNRALSYQKLQNYSQAIEDYTQAINLDSNDADTYNSRGNTYADIGNYNQAISDYNQALKLNPNDAKAYYNRGLVYGINLQNYSHAISDFTKSLQIAPRNFEAYYNRGLAYAYLKNYQQAISDFSQTINLNPNSADAYNNRGYIYEILGNYQQAISDFNQAINLNPTNALTYANRGNCYKALGNYSQAKSDYDKAKQLR